MKSLFCLLILMGSLNAFSQGNKSKGVEITYGENNVKKLRWIENCDKFYEMHGDIDPEKVKCVNIETIDWVRCDIKDGTITDNCREFQCEYCTCESLSRRVADKGYVLVTCIEHANGGASGEVVKLELNKAKARRYDKKQAIQVKKN